MDILSTKTRAEREDDEAKRLVRPAPKLKPPRRDRRRERMNPDSEKDPDEEADKKDRSENYKTIGGSIRTAHMVMARYLWAIEFPTSEARKKYLEEHPDADPSKHTVKEEEEAPAAEEEAGKEKPPKAEEEVEETEKPKRDLPAIGGQLRDLGKKDKALGAQLKLFQPGGFYFEMAKENPDFAIAQLPWSKALPEEMRGLTVGDVKEAIEKAAPPVKGKGKKPKPGEAAPPEAQPPKAKPSAKPEAAPPEAKVPPEAAPPETEAKPEAAPPEAKPEAEEAPPEVQPEAEEEAPPEAVKPAKPKIPQPMRPKASPMEKAQAQEQLSDVFGDTTAAELAATGIHPQDVSTLVDMYQAMSSQPEKNISEYAAKVAEFYETDPRKVPPPKSGQNAAGDTVPFDQLSPEEQAESYRTHQLRTVAISMSAERGVRAAISKQLPKGTDARVAGELAAVLLQPPNEARSAWASRAADRSYQTALQSIGEPIPPKNVKALLETLGDNDDAKKIAVGYLQGQDFNIARNIFLRQGPGLAGAVKKGLGWVAKAAAAPAQFLWDVLVGDERDPDYEVDAEEAQKVADEYESFNEWSSPRQIGKGVKAAQDFFDLRAKYYPEELTTERDPSQLFRQQILQRVKSLAPDKYAPVKAHLEEYDFNRYEQKQADYEQKLAEWEQERDLQLHQAQGKEPQEPSREKFKSDEEFAQAQAAHTSLKEDRQAAEWAWEQKNPMPKAPMKPVNYDRSRNPKALREMRKWLLAEQFSQHGGKTAASVAARYVISSYPTPRSMAPVSEKAAVYHGVAPYKDTPAYTHWQQPRQRDITEADYEIILKSAREWVKTPVLKVPLVGATKDAQLRAALDLAIYESRYNGAIQPNIYNLLLGRLAGVDTNETLLTQRTKGVYSPLEQGQKVANMKASSEIRKLAAKYAAENATLAYDLMDLATRLAQDEGQDQGQQKQAQQEQDQGQKQAAKYASLRTVVIQAAHKNPDARAAFIPVLQAVKSLDV